VPLIHGAKEALSVFGSSVMAAMSVRLKRSLIDDLALERGGIHIERIGARKMDFDCAAENSS